MKFQSIEEIKNTYRNYGSEFWTWKRCNYCQKQFTLENHSHQEIELVFCEVRKVDEYHGSEGAEVKWYHKVCLTHLSDTVKEISKLVKKTLKKTKKYA